MSKHIRVASSVSSFDAELEDNQIERIGGEHLDGDEGLRLGWDIQYFSSQEINPILLKMFLEGRFGRDGYGLSLIGHTMYQLWSPDPLPQVVCPKSTFKPDSLTSAQTDIDSCKDASRDLDNKYRVIYFGDSKQSQQ